MTKSVFIKSLLTAGALLAAYAGISAAFAAAPAMVISRDFDVAYSSPEAAGGAGDRPNRVAAKPAKTKRLRFMISSHIPHLVKFVPVKDLVISKLEY